MRTTPEPDPATRRGRILDFIRSQGPLGATDTEIAQSLGLNPKKVVKLRLKLWNQEFIGTSGKPRPRRAIAWMALAADFYESLKSAP